MHVYEYLTIIALLAGPIMSVGVQLWFENRRESRHRKIAILDVLMANRGRILSSEPVRALNRIDIVFYDNERIRQKWAELFMQFERRAPEGPETDALTQRRNDLIAELIGLIADSLGYRLEHTEVKGRMYRPQAFADEEEYQLRARQAILPILKGEQALKVDIADRP